jgi:hypothetical protein
MDERREASARAGWKGWSLGGAEIFADKVKVTERCEKGLEWVAEKEFDG